MIVEVLEEARPQLRNESHARGYTALGFEVGPPAPTPPAVSSEETPTRPLAVILESNMECATPKLTSLRRKLPSKSCCWLRLVLTEYVWAGALVRGSPAVILPGQGMCSRASAATAVSLGRDEAELVASKRGLPKEESLSLKGLYGQRICREEEICGRSLLQLQASKPPNRQDELSPNDVCRQILAQKKKKKLRGATSS